MPLLPSAFGLGGAKRTGGLDRTLDPPMRSDSPNWGELVRGTKVGEGAHAADGGSVGGGFLVCP
eukprot:scaffold14476_cov120-Isochrysis_galbana.AAC.11